MEKAKRLDAIPYDVKNVELGHHGKECSFEAIVKKYNLTQLVYYECGEDIREAIAREKQLKGWRRSKKVGLINSSNPRWEDLSEAWFDNERTEIPRPSASG